MSAGIGDRLRVSLVLVTALGHAPLAVACLPPHRPPPRLGTAGALGCLLGVWCSFLPKVSIVAPPPTIITHQASSIIRSSLTQPPPLELRSAPPCTTTTTISSATKSYGSIPSMLPGGFAPQGTPVLRRQTIPFLSLPSEVRNTIYRLCVIKPRWHGYIVNQTLCQPAISRTNRLVRQESLYIFYTNNCFGLRLRLRTDWEYPHPMRPFWQHVDEDPPSMAFLRDITNLSNSPYFPLMAGLEITASCQESFGQDGTYQGVAYIVRILTQPPINLDDDVIITRIARHWPVYLSRRIEDDRVHKDFSRVTLNWSNSGLVAATVQYEVLDAIHNFGMAYRDLGELDFLRILRLGEALHALLGRHQSYKHVYRWD